jgi:hypothetical protein
MMARMRRPNRALLILAIGGGCRAAPTGNLRLCHENATGNPDVAIAACTVAIGSGRLSGADLAGASLDRGIAYLHKEDYGHWVRDEAEWNRIAASIENNPVKVGLVARAEEYRWSSARGVAMSACATA